MHDDLDLRVIERRHDADPAYRADLRRRLEEVLEGGGTMTRDDVPGEVVAVELDAPEIARPDHRRRWVQAVALVAAAAAVVGIVVVGTGGEPLDRTGDSVPAGTSTTPDAAATTVVPSPTTTGTTEPATSGGMWPQSSIEEVRAAQDLADAGDPAVAWQVEPELVADEYEDAVDVELVSRFLHEVLGWEAYLFHPTEEGRVRNGQYVDLPGQRYLRCAAGRTNPLYPPGPGAEPERGQLCAPTIDDLTYEAVSLDLAQPARRGADGVWVVERWSLAAPYAQADPALVEAQGRERLEEFLAARVAGAGAEGLVGLPQEIATVPLLYAASSGAPYERYEIDRAGPPHWPSGSTTFSARLFAAGGPTVVEQEFFWWGDGALRMDRPTTIEDGAPLALAYTSTDGEVTLNVPSTWEARRGGPLPGLAMWSWELSKFGTAFEERIELTDPVAYDAWCAAQGGSPLLSGPADAAAIAQLVAADPDLVVTEPVAARVGGLEAVVMDVTLAPGGRMCGIGMIDVTRWIHALWEPGWRVRLYLVDLPEGMSVRTLAITAFARDDRFDDVVAEAAPVIESIEFHPT